LEVIEVGYIPQLPTSATAFPLRKPSLFDLETLRVFSFCLAHNANFEDANLFKEHFERAQKENMTAFTKP
jgi:hypothetical protein